MPGTSEERQPTLSESYTTVFAQEEMAGTSPERQPIPSESYATESRHYQENSTAMMDTALIIEELDKLFDFTNGPSCAEDIKIGLRQNVSIKTKHLKVWTDFKKKLLNTKFIDGDGKPSTKVKCRGYVLSMDTLRDIWYLLRKKYGFKHMNLRQFNQDALENIFGIIRQYNPTNRNPTCTNFIAALKSTIISGLTAPHSRSANCQKDYQKLLTNFHDMLFEENPTEPDLDQHVLSKTTESETVQITDVHSEVPVLTIPEEFDIVETDFTEIDKQPCTRRWSKLSVSEVRDAWYCLMPTRYPLYLHTALGIDGVGQNQASPEM
ncbi:hypothetical protein EVAR_88119_1 [Eumeta japonica]|uniref:Transposable element P transposase-like RNase H C-terminal domain-containing protein n=1 Tax=Eumeta variegata TaxID=151549 RepID=A0A4C1WT16_EUMVA|nr:hypothetical protein EVAR_88119_1 [Eumeta japonica]